MAGALSMMLSTGLDPDVERFFLAATITDPTQRLAIQDMVLSLKKESLWSLLYALYPLVGGNATAHAQNLVSASYSITWTNAPTQNSNGVTFNGTTQYGTCVGLTGNSVFPHLGGMGCYRRTTNNASSGAARRDMGIVNTAFSLIYDVEYLDIAASENNRAIAGSTANIAVAGGTTEYTGSVAYNRTSSTALALYNNGSSVATATGSDSSTPPSVDMMVGALNWQGTGAISFSAENYAAFWFNSAMTSGQASTFATIIETYQDALGRGVV